MFFWRKKKENNIASVFDFPHADKQERQHSLIGYGVHVTGDVRFAGSLRVDGRVDGRVETKPDKRGVLIVSKDAVVNGPVFVTNMVINGTINGDIYVAGRLECRPGAKIRGQVRYQNLSMAEGAVIEGKFVKMDNVEEPDVVSIVHDGEAPAQISSFLEREAK